MRSRKGVVDLQRSNRGENWGGQGDEYQKRTGEYWGSYKFQAGRKSRGGR